MTEIEVERKVALILATQYWLGTQEKEGIKDMSRSEYLNKSAIHWLPAARGVISLVKECKE